MLFLKSTNLCLDAVTHWQYLFIKFFIRLSSKLTIPTHHSLAQTRLPDGGQA